MKNNTPTPVCLFVYNRPAETRQALASLQACRTSGERELYIFSDAAKTPETEAEVAEVRRCIRRAYGFRAIHLDEAELNRGLAASIIRGVTRVLEAHGQAIVLEDDLLLSPDFLEYMDQALAAYAGDKRIWSISGYGPDIPIPSEYPHGVYLTPRASSWGWGTWLDRWNCIDWEVKDYADFRRDGEALRRFDEGGNDMSRLLALQQRRRINSWAIRWCYAQFRRGMYTVYPVRSKVVNQGFGANASHAGWHDARHQVRLSGEKVEMVEELEPDARLLTAFKRHQDLSLISKAGYFLRLHGLGYRHAQKIFKKIINN